MVKYENILCGHHDVCSISRMGTQILLFVLIHKCNLDPGEVAVKV